MRRFDEEEVDTGPTGPNDSSARPVISQAGG